jgi:Cd2+/Zn2+-exporting ATPase
MTDRSPTSQTDASTTEALTWRVQGMDCASCVAKVRTAVERLPGILGVEVNLMAERLTV